ncbi:hypothetical protein ACWCWQ_34515 [Streptomyces sp. NPDC001571]
MILRRHHQGRNDPPDAHERVEDEQSNGPPGKKPAARSAARTKPRG